MRPGKLRQHMVSFLLQAFLIVGCGSIRVTRTPTVIPFSETPKPTRTLVPTVPSLTPTPSYTATPTRVLIPPPIPPSLQAIGLDAVMVKTLCLKVEQDYLGNKLNEPIAETAQRILATLAIKVALDRDPCEATLKFDLTFEVSGKEYIGGNYCYNGVGITGKMTLNISGQKPFTKPMSFPVLFPRTMARSDCRDDPKDAPFYQAWSWVVLEGLTELWGPVILIASLHDNDSNIYERSTTMLENLGPQAKIAVPALINCLDNVSTNIASKYDCRNAIMAITGQNFDLDQDRWWQWWDEQ